MGGLSEPVIRLFVSGIACVPPGLIFQVYALFHGGGFLSSPP